MRLSWQVFSIFEHQSQPGAEATMMVCSPLYNYQHSLMIKMIHYAGHYYQPCFQMAMDAANYFKQQHWLQTYSNICSLTHQMSKTTKQRSGRKSEIHHNLRSNLLTILKHLKAKRDIGQLSNSIENQKQIKWQAETTDNTENIQLHGFVPDELLRFPRNYSLLTSPNGRNSYNIYPVLEKQEIEQKLAFTRKSQKTEHSAGKTRKHDKLPQLNLDPNESVYCSQLKQNQNSMNNNIVMRQVARLRNTLNVNKKAINQNQTKPNNKRYALNVLKKNKIKENAVGVDSYFWPNIKSNANEVSSWNSAVGSKEDEENSLQLLIL